MSYRYCGRDFKEDEIARIRLSVDEDPGAALARSYRD